MAATNQRSQCWSWKPPGTRAIRFFVLPNLSLADTTLTARRFLKRREAGEASAAGSDATFGVRLYQKIYQSDGGLVKCILRVISSILKK